MQLIVLTYRQVERGVYACEDDSQSCGRNFDQIFLSILKFNKICSLTHKGKAHLLSHFDGFIYIFIYQSWQKITTNKQKTRNQTQITQIEIYRIHYQCMRRYLTSKFRLLYGRDERIKLEETVEECMREFNVSTVNDVIDARKRKFLAKYSLSENSLRQVFALSAIITVLTILWPFVLHCNLDKFVSFLFLFLYYQFGEIKLCVCAKRPKI